MGAREPWRYYIRAFHTAKAVYRISHQRYIARAKHEYNCGTFLTEGATKVTSFILLCHLILKGQLVGNKGDEFTVSGLVVLAVDLKAEKLVDVFYLAPCPGDLYGVADGALHLA